MSAENKTDAAPWKGWLIAALVAVLWLPILADYFSVLQQRDLYKLWPLLAVVILVLFVMRWRRAPVAEHHPPRWVMWLGFLAALGLMLFAFLYWVPYVATMAWIVIMGVAALYVSSLRRVENLLGLWLLLLIFLRPPYQMSLRLMVWMENLTMSVASKLLDYGGTVHAVQGNTLALPKHDFRIDVICSGTVSLVSMVACIAVVCVVRNRHFFHTVLSLLMAGVAAWVLNIIRVLLVLRIYTRTGMDLTDGAYLLYYDMLSFLLGMALVLCADSLVVFLFDRAKKDVLDSDMIRRMKSPFSRLWNAASQFELTSVLRCFVSSRPLRLRQGAFVFVLLLLISFIGLEATVKYYRGSVIKMDYMYQDEEDLTKLGEGSLVINRNGWEFVSFDSERRDFDNIWGAFSSTWRLKYNGLTVTLSLDYPFHEWHDVKRCYYKVGWKLVDERIIDTRPVFEWPASETEMTIPNGDSGYILCSNCDHLGNPILPKPAKHDYTMLLYRLHPDKMTPPFGSSYEKDRRTLYQTQCMVSTPMPLDESTKKEIQLMYADFREQIRQAIAAKGQQNQGG